MKSLALIVLFCTCTVSNVLAQAPCFGLAQSSDACSDICIICDFSSFSGSTIGFVGQTPPGGACFDVENEQWIGFAAVCNSLTMVLTPNNCTGGNGLQMAAYAACNGVPIACNAGSAGGGTTPLAITIPTLPGKNYYLMIDGYLGDECNFTVTGLPPGCAGIPMIMPALPIQGQSEVCPGGTGLYSVPPVSGANAYVWEGPPGCLIKGQPSPVTTIDTQVDIVFPNQPASAVYEICVRPVNSCSEGDRICKTVVVPNIPPTVLPNVTVCQDDLPYITPWGDTVNATGLYFGFDASAVGCDSVFRQFVFVSPPIFRVLPPITLAPGDSVVVCGQAFTLPGAYSAVCPASNGCDSTVQFVILGTINTSELPSLIRSLVAISPNPTTGVVLMSSAIYAESEKINYQVVNTLGQRVGGERNQMGRVRFDATSLASGVYFVEMSSLDGRKRAVGRFVKE